MPGHRKALLIVLSLFIFALSSATLSAVTSDEIITLKTYLSTDPVSAGSDFQMALEMKLLPGWHINSNRPSSEFAIPTELHLDLPEGIKVKEMRFPKHEVKFLPSIGQKTEFYSGTSYIIITAHADRAMKPGRYSIPATFRYQGCDKDICLPPNEKKVAFSFKVAPPGSLVQMINSKIFPGEGGTPEGEAKSPVTSTEKGDSKGNISGMVAEKGLLISLLLIFLGGLALNLTPCVYPLIPVTLSYFGGMEHRGKAFLNASAYLFGIVLTYSILGTLAALSGEMLGTQLTSPAVTVFIAIVMVGLSLSMFGLYEIRVPRFVMNLVGGEAKTGFAGSLLMGATMGIVAAPCIGPFVVGLLTYVASTGDPFKGFIMFFFLALGLGIPYLFLAFFSTKISSLPRSGVWMIGVRKIFGIILLVMAVYFLDPLLKKETYDLLFSLVLFAGGGWLIIFDRSGDNARFFHIIKSVVAIGMITTALLTYNPLQNEETGMKWTYYSEEVMEKARSEGTPVIMDFYADWCIPCKELEEITFKSPGVKAYAGTILFVKVDLTQEKSEFAKKVKARYDIKGVPTVVFVGRDGKERHDLRLTGFEGPEKFIERIKSLLKTP